MLASTIVPYIIMLTVYWKTNFLGEIFLFLPFFFQRILFPFSETYFDDRFASRVFLYSRETTVQYTF